VSDSVATAPAEYRAREAMPTARRTRSKREVCRAVRVGYRVDKQVRAIDPALSQARTLEAEL